MTRPKENRIRYGVRVAPGTPARLKKIAKELGVLYGGDGWPGKLLDAIASGEYILTPKDDIRNS